MRVLISDVIRKEAFDFNMFQKVPGFLKNPVEALKKVVVDFILKDPENNLMPVLNYINKPSKRLKTSLKPLPKGSPRPQPRKPLKITIPALIIGALMFLVGVLGPSVFSKDIEKDVQDKLKDKSLVETIKENYAEKYKAIEGEFE